MANYLSERGTALKILIIGCGSIGQRHLRNLTFLGMRNMLVFDVRRDRLEQIRQMAPSARGTDQLRDLLQEKPDACLITVPTSLHAQYAKLMADQGCHLFIEKPLSNDLRGLDSLVSTVQKKKLIGFVGYNYRFNPSVLKVRDYLEQGKIGRVITARSYFGSYLPDRHPGEDYRKGYGARRTLGGGVILDALSHHFDLWFFLFGRPREALAAFGKRSALEMDVEDCCDTMIRFKNGLTVGLHANFLERPARNFFEIVGEKGTICCDLAKGEASIFSPKRKKWTIFSTLRDYNLVYVREVEEFMRCVREKKRPSVDLFDAKQELEMLLKIKKTNTTKRWVSL